MISEILINVGAGETRVALIEDGVLQGFAAQSVFADGRMGDVHLGRVTKVVPAMQAAFVDIGLARDGFLSLRDTPDPLQEGAAIAVKITREAVGEKGAKLTARFVLPPQLEARRKMARPPQLLQSGLGVIEAALKDIAPGTGILIDDARAALACPAAQLVKDDLFARHDLEDQVAALSRPRVALPGGGWITIEPTEALTAIDVNSGGFTASGGRAETAQAVNLEAAREIARQVRLRGIGGLIVIDFIQMQDAAQAAAIVAALKEGLARAGGEVEIAPVTGFGIVAIARQRGATAVRPAVEKIGQDILRAVERSARAAPGREIVVRCGQGVAEWLARPEIRAGLDRRGVGRVRWLAEKREDFDVTTSP